MGYLGPIKLKGGGVATEYSIGINIDGEEIEMPTLVPSLTKKEIESMRTDIIPNRKKIPKTIVKKAVDHAMKRRKEFKSPFHHHSEKNIILEVKDGKRK